MKMLKFPLFLYYCICIVFYSTSSIQAQSADEIINKYIEATGGRALWAKVSSIKSTGNYVMGPSMLAPITSIRINKPFMATYSDFSWQGMTSKSATKDSSGWSYNPFGGKREADPISPDRMRSMLLDNDPRGLLCVYKELKCTADYLGMEDFEGVEVHKVRITNLKGDMMYYYFDASSYFVIKTMEKIRLSEKEMTSTSVFSDYRKTAYGIWYPYCVQELEEDGKESGGPVQYNKVEFNTTIDLSIFEFPKK